MRTGALFRVLFVFYCIEVGVLMLMLPWSVTWDRSVVQISALVLRSLLLHPALRGAVTGFGLVHLLWAMHDLDLWILERRLRDRPPA